jgi:DMSO/TMAO reductase YedYZ molybdopterin-dependent catalytic subunit
MFWYNGGMKHRLILLAALALLLAAAPGGRLGAESRDNEAGGYLQLVDGLHVTGRPPDIDIAAYRLRIVGMVERELSLSFGEIKELPAAREYAELDCPGFFTDKGTWTGVRVRDLLELAGLKKRGSTLTFTSADGSYSQTLSLDKAADDGLLIAYRFEDRELPPVHGFPLRLVARGEPGYIWVKWLGEIAVSR